MSHESSPQRPQPHQKSIDFGSLLAIGVMLLAVSQGLEGMASPFAQFTRGVLIGLSIVCNLIGLVLYGKARQP